MVSPPQGVDIKEQLREIVQKEITSGTVGTASVLKEEIRDVVQKEITSGTVGNPSVLKEEIRKVVQDEITSGTVGTKSILRDEIEKELRKELTSGDAAVPNPLLQEKVDSIFNKSVTAGANILASDYSVPHECVLRLMITLDTAAVLSYTLTRGTAAGIDVNLNGGSNLTASAAHMFDISLLANDVVNFKVDTGCTVLQFDVLKIRVPGP